MAMKLDGPLANRADWQAGDRCSIDRALQVVGTRSAMLLLREAFFGTTRFDDFAQRVGITDTVASSRLKELVEAGLMVKEPYREPGRRTRYEYVLTEMGRDLLPVVLALMQWGDKYLQRGGAPLRVVEGSTGASVGVRVCGDDGRELGLDELRVKVNR
ncbi:helix-turn-helix transcriptional regulator [Rhodococcus sp. D2-41]|uniref:Helix-turn-helix transcriptional regulator n=1 Tax=Speluncibacter jeojiensis TaxID=2710754 RepID=A0A9X4LZX8_9ACTN|nr:helix-turn-helix domain-containing protein [Rhodococcus sp. D2-41]MDG3010533.1 helix-turn-helix transcriptional regulator [Rhodococcus sp. D2-41]MDG3014282.1 helix-turn-helix transcriptional regulator [Corynebacteriales bacterium D3-21]